MKILQQHSELYSQLYVKPNVDSVGKGNSHPGHAVASLDKTIYDKLSLLGGFKQAANLMDKNSKQSAERLDPRKLLNRCGFLLA